MQPSERELAIIRRKIGEISLSDSSLEILKDYQISHVKNLLFVLKYGNCALDMSDTGTGKTFAALIVCKEMCLRPLVICPKSIIPAWYETCELLGIQPLTIVNYESAKKGKTYENLEQFYDNKRVQNPYINVHYMIRPGETKNEISHIDWDLPNNSLIIFDEAHKGKSGLMSSIKSAVSKLMASCKMFLNREAMKFAIFLSATITDKMDFIDVITYHLGFYEVYDIRHYEHFIHSLGVDSLARTEKLHKILMPRYASRMTKDSADFTNSAITAEMVEIDAQSSEAIEREHQRMAEALQDLRNRTLPGAMYLVILLRARQKIELLKIPAYVRKIQEHLAAGRHVVVFLNFKETKQNLTDIITGKGILPLTDIDYIDGTNTPESRNIITQKFKADEIKLLICNIASGGVALSLHDVIGNHPRASIVSPPWSAIQLLQSLGRIDRSGAKSDTIQQIIYVNSPNTNNANGTLTYTVEEQICKTVKEKIGNISNINNGDLSGMEIFE